MGGMEGEGEKGGERGDGGVKICRRGDGGGGGGVGGGGRNGNFRLEWELRAGTKAGG